MVTSEVLFRKNLRMASGFLPKAHTGPTARIPETSPTEMVPRVCPQNCRDFLPVSPSDTFQCPHAISRVLLFKN